MFEWHIVESDSDEQPVGLDPASSNAAAVLFLLCLVLLALLVLVLLLLVLPVRLLVMVLLLHPAISGAPGSTPAAGKAHLKVHSIHFTPCPYRRKVDDSMYDQLRSRLSGPIWLKGLPLTLMPPKACEHGRLDGLEQSGPSEPTWKEGLHSQTRDSVGS